VRRTTCILLILLCSAPAFGLTGVNRWAVQLQRLDVSEVVAADDFDLIVMDYSADGTDDGEWSPAQIDAIRDGGKTPVAYLSVGEAETYRWYWQSAWETQPPDWLGPVNPNWSDNFKVRFWDPEWQAIVFDYVDRILAQGFDGLYLDVIDAWYYWSDTVPERSQAAADMADFVIALRAHATAAGRGDLLIIPQNGETLVLESTVTGAKADQYYGAIDAVGVESLFHRGPQQEDNPWQPDVYRLTHLYQYLMRDIAVLSIEYLTDDGARDYYYQYARQIGYIPYATRHGLDQLSPQPAVGVDGGVLSWRCGPARPNPASHMSFLPVATPAGGGPVVLELCDTRGRLLYSRREDLSGTDAILSLPRPVAPGADTAAGTYVYRLRHGGATVGSGKISFVR